MGVTDEIVAIGLITISIAGMYFGMPEIAYTSVGGLIAYFTGLRNGKTRALAV